MQGEEPRARLHLLPYADESDGTRFEVSGGGNCGHGTARVAPGLKILSLGTGLQPPCGLGVAAVTETLIVQGRRLQDSDLAHMRQRLGAHPDWSRWRLFAGVGGALGLAQ